MKGKLTELLMIAGLLLTVCSIAPGQEKPRPLEGPNKVGEIVVSGDAKPVAEVSYDSFKLVAPKFALSKTITGEPFSPTAFTESVQTLSDGNQIVRRDVAKMYRDSQGRTRNEDRVEKIGKWTAAGGGEPIVFINDPVSGFTYSLIPGTRTAYKYTIKASLQEVRYKIAAIEKSSVDKQGPYKVAEPEWNSAAKPLPEKTARPDTTLRPKKVGENQTDDGRRKKESLGKQVIEGVEAEGTRTTVTIPAGEIGNVLPIEIVDELWYSPQLQLTVLSKRNDPRVGETTYRLINISRSEPDHSLFEVGPDYTIKDESAAGPMKKRTREEQE